MLAAGKSIIKKISNTFQVKFGAPQLRRFYKITLDARGMLHPRIYYQMYSAMLPLQDLDVVEIGGAAGASSIALALGMKESGKQSKLIVIEKCEGGSRLPLGDYNYNYAQIVKNLQAFDVWEQVRLFPEYLTLENGQDVLDMIKTPKIAALIHDADGRIDRDFYLFWEHLIPGGTIIIDDCEDKAEYKEISERYPDGGTKKITTYRLTQLFLEWSLLTIDHIERGTVFAHKPQDADFTKFDLAACERLVANIMSDREAHLSAVRTA